MSNTRKRRQARPGTAIEKIPEPQEVELSIAMKRAMLAGQIQMGTRAYEMGACHILVSPPQATYGWHLSISTTTRYPTWDEVAQARYSLLDNALTMALILPPREEYINIHEFVFQLHEITRESKQPKNVLRGVSYSNLFLVRW